MRIKIINPGVLSTVQDLGRYDYLSQAVPVSGAMDKLSARLANICIGNNGNDAIIEFTYGNASFIAETDLLIAYAGDGAIVQIDNTNLPSHKPVFIPQGKAINLKQESKGCRSYLAICGGWDVPMVLGSRSTFLTAEFGGFEGRCLKKNDTLISCEPNAISQSLFDQLKGDKLNHPDWSIASEFSYRDKTKPVRVVLAHEHDWFEQQSRDEFFNTEYRISINSNRMALNLEGPKINRVKQDELLSTAVVPGTIQITGDGSPILLTADCQTTGGYPRIAKVAAVDLDACGQLKPGDALTFAPISNNEAEMLYIEQEINLKKLAAAIKLKYT